MQIKRLLIGLSITLLWLAAALPVNGSTPSPSMEVDIEKPKPEFSRAGADIIARLTPRAKNSAIQIQFSVRNAKLAAVLERELDHAQAAQVDIKDFRSAYFEIQLTDLTPRFGAMRWAPCSSGFSGYFWCWAS